jgi:glutaredoxin
MTIRIYSTSSCAACVALEEWLGHQDVDYIKKIIDTDEAAMAEFMVANEGAISVPFTVIISDTGQVTKISGFDPKKFTAALGHE